jgi:hypothetical protein
MKKVILIIMFLNAIKCVNAQDIDPQDNDPCGCHAKYATSVPSVASHPDGLEEMYDWQRVDVASIQGEIILDELAKCLFNCKSAQKNPIIQHRTYRIVGQSTKRAVLVNTPQSDANWDSNQPVPVVTYNGGMTQQGTGMQGRTPNSIEQKNTSQMGKQAANIKAFNEQMAENWRNSYRKQKEREEERIRLMVDESNARINEFTATAKQGVADAQNIKYGNTYNSIFQSKSSNLTNFSSQNNLSSDLLVNENTLSNRNTKIQKLSSEKINEKISDIVVSYEKEEGYYYEIQDKEGNCYDVYDNLQDAHTIVTRTNLKNWSLIIGQLDNGGTKYVVVPIRFTKATISDDPVQLQIQPAYTPPQTPSNTTQKGTLQTHIPAWKQPEQQQAEPSKTEPSKTEPSKTETATTNKGK